MYMNFILLYYILLMLVHFLDGQLFTATVADFSGGDPLIYREPQRTERYDLKQLNGILFHMLIILKRLLFFYFLAPDFVSSFAYGDYIFFMYRETAVEYINCGKVSVFWDNIVI